jgi:hypothetical protein
MKDNDSKLLAEAYSKVYLKEGSISDYVSIEMGEGGLEPREGTDDIARASVIEVDGVKYIVSANVKVNTEYDYDAGDREVGVGASFNLKNDVQVEFETLKIETMERVMTEYGEEYKTVYDLSDGQVSLDELQNSKVVEAAKDEVEKRIQQDLYNNPEKYDTDEDAGDYNPEDDRDWEQD